MTTQSTRWVSKPAEGCGEPSGPWWWSSVKVPPSATMSGTQRTAAIVSVNHSGWSANHRRVVTRPPGDEGFLGRKGDGVLSIPTGQVGRKGDGVLSIPRRCVGRKGDGPAFRPNRAGGTKGGQF